MSKRHTFNAKFTAQQFNALLIDNLLDISATQRTILEEFAKLNAEKSGNTVEDEMIALNQTKLRYFNDMFAQILSDSDEVD